MIHTEGRNIPAYRERIAFFGRHEEREVRMSHILCAIGGAVVAIALHCVVIVGKRGD